MLEKAETINDSIKGKLDKTSKRFKARFLLMFTQEMIRHSKVEEFFVLENLIKKRDKKQKQEEKHFENKYGGFIPSLMHREPTLRKIEIGETKPIFAPISPPQRHVPRRRPRQPLTIPEFPLPPRLQYIRPTPNNAQVDLGKLNPLIQDPKVKVIECNGTDENIIVKGGMGARTTNIILNKEEINQVLEKFSEASKIPIHEGIFKIVVGTFILSAIVSDVVGSKFIIKRMMPQRMPPQMSGIPPPRF